MNFELKREEEALASRETPPESHLLDAVRDLVEGEDDGGPIFECSWDKIASSRVHWGRGPLETSENILGTLQAVDQCTYYVSAKNISSTFEM